MDPRKQNFIDSVLKLRCSNRTGCTLMQRSSKKSYIYIYIYISEPILQNKTGQVHWKRMHQLFKTVHYQTKHSYLKRKVRNSRNKCLLSIEAMYDTILRVFEDNHIRRDGLHKILAEEYHGVTEKACVFFLANCKECHLRKEINLSNQQQ